MIDIHYWPTPNGKKVTILLEELGVPYTIVPVDIARGGQFEPGFLAVSPGNKVPAIVDREPADGGAPVSVFESGAILEYLADKHGRFLPRDARGRARVTQWVYWQAANQGPVFGTANHFITYAPERIPYALERYDREVKRIFGILDRQLAGRDWLLDEYSIADIQCWPWATYHQQLKQDIAQFPNVARWIDRMRARPAVARGWAVRDDLRTYTPATLTEEQKSNLFGAASGGPALRGGAA